MNNSNISEPVFREAVEAIDNGDIVRLKELLAEYPELASTRLDTPNEDGYFKNPYLLWFVANNPIRHEELPDNILEIMDTIIENLLSSKDAGIQYILNYTLGLVSTGRIVREWGIQIEMMELLITNGAKVNDNVLGPIGQQNFRAAEYLLSKGANYNLATAVGLGRMDDIKRLIPAASASKLYAALLVAAFFGKVELIKLLIEAGADVNGQALPEDIGGFHSHASPLHQAVYSGSLEVVRILIGAGSDLHKKDSAFKATPMDWAIYAQAQKDTAEEKAVYEDIENYLLTIYR